MSAKPYLLLKLEVLGQLLQFRNRGQLCRWLDLWSRDNKYVFETVLRPWDTTRKHCALSVKMTDQARWKATVYIGGLPPMVTAANLEAAFLPFGEIADVTLP